MTRSLDMDVWRLFSFFAEEEESKPITREYGRHFNILREPPIYGKMAFLIADPNCEGQTYGLNTYGVPIHRIYP